MHGGQFSNRDATFITEDVACSGDVIVVATILPKLFKPEDNSEADWRFFKIFFPTF